jgi:hypothetical protein
MVVKKKICNGCKEEKLIHKCIDGKKYCKYCTYILIPPKQTVTKTVINRVSDKKKQKDVEYSKLRKLYLESHPFCEAKLPGICTAEATDIHHMSGKIGDDYLDVNNFIALCRVCHVWVENNPTEAKELGFSKNRLT